MLKWGFTMVSVGGGGGGGDIPHFEQPCMSPYINFTPRIPHNSRAGEQGSLTKGKTKKKGLLAVGMWALFCLLSFSTLSVDRWMVADSLNTDTVSLSLYFLTGRSAPVIEHHRLDRPEMAECTEVSHASCY